MNFSVIKLPISHQCKKFIYLKEKTKMYWKRIVSKKILAMVQN